MVAKRTIEVKDLPITIRNCLVIIKLPVEVAARSLSELRQQHVSFIVPIICK